MGDLSEFSLPMRLFLKGYRWRTIDPIPWTPAADPRQSSVALLSSGGFVAPGQAPFDPSIKGGDSSFRLIEATADVRSLRSSHRSEAFDRSGIDADANLGIPIDRMRELERGGEIGSFSPRVVSFMGSITATKRLVRESAPRMADALQEDGARIALLVPV